MVFQDARGGEKIRKLAAGAGADIRAVQFHIAHLAHGGFVIRRMRPRHHGLQLFRPVAMHRVESGIRIIMHDLERPVGAFAHIRHRFGVRGNHAVFAAGLDNHVAQGHAVFHGHGFHRIAGELHGAVTGAIHADVADDAQDDVLGHDVRRQLAVDDEAHGFGNAHPDFAGAEDERGIGVADAGGELAECAGGAGVAIGAEQHLARAGPAFFSQRDVADAFVPRRAHVVKMRQVLLAGKLPQQLDVAVGMHIRGEDVMIRDHHHALGVPHTGVFAEFPFKNGKGGRPANIVGHEHIHVHPDIVAGFDAPHPRMPRQNFLGYGHSHGCCPVVGLSGSGICFPHCPGFYFCPRR